MTSAKIRQHHDPDGIAAWPGRLVTIAGAWVLISIPLRPLHGLRVVDQAFGLINVPAQPNLFVAAALLVLGSALRRRLRAAFILLLVYEVAATLLDAVVGAIGVTFWNDEAKADLDLSRVDIVLAVVAAVLGVAGTILLVRCRRAFPARLAHGSRRAALVVLLSGLAASWILAFSLTTLFPDTLRGAGERVVWANRAALGLGRPNGAVLHGHHGHHWEAIAVSTISALVLLVAVSVFLRSARAAQYMTAEPEVHLRRLLLQDGERDSLGYFATRRDKSVIFSPDGRAAVTYRVVASVSMASGDPIGHVSSWPGAIEAWLTESRQHGWFPAVLSAGVDGANAYVNAGLKALTIGDEAILEVTGFDLLSREMRPVRRAITRVRAAGYTCSVRRQSAIGAEELAELDRVAAAWRGDGGSERGFSMALGRFGDPADGRCVVVTAFDARGAIRGVLTFVPWGVRGLSLDMMRTDRQAENGLTEFMVGSLVESCQDLGVRRISLNFAMFRSVFSSADSVGAGPVTRLTDAVLGVASRFWQLESLYRANAKYLPAWVPRFLCYDSSLTLSRAVLAAGVAEGFLPWLEPAVPDPTGDMVGDLPFLAAVRAQEDQLLRPVRPPRRLSQQEQARHDKMDRLFKHGLDAYPVAVPRTTGVAAVRAAHSGLGPDARTGMTVSVTGRVRALRDLGGVAFGVLQEGDVTLQVMLTDDRTPLAARQLWRRTVDLGDHVSVTGEVVTSRRGELSVLADEWEMAAKCLHPLPDVHAGFTDPEARVSQRYLDLMVNPDAMRVLRHRSAAVKALRDAFAVRGYLEVETPMLQAVHGGAAARPFRTHINAYNSELYLRIAPELYLKRLCVAGMDRVFELNRNFRNEGVDATHNPEFTSLEAYQAYADYSTMRELTRELILEVATAVHGRPVAMRPDADGVPVAVDLSEPWPVVTVHEAVSRAGGTRLTPATPAMEVRAVCDRHGVHAPADATSGELVVELYDALVEKQTVYPTFYTDFPLETSPLTRAHRSDPRLAERWDLVAYGMELGTAYSELIDPVEQRDRLTAQSLKAAAGDPEAMQIDEAFLTALEYAMPPTGGLGLGVDRLVMLLTGTAIRATLAFPFVRPTGSAR